MFEIDERKAQRLLTPLSILEPPTARQGPARGGYFQQARMLNDPRLAQANPEIAAATAMDIPDLLAMQETARSRGRNQHLQKQRGAFERQVSIKLSHCDQVKQVVQRMADKAVSYLMKTRGVVTALGMLGSDPTQPGTPAYGGMVGHDPGAVRDVLSRGGDGVEGGNLREQMLALQSFQSVLGDDLTQSKRGPDGQPIGIGVEKMKQAMNVPVDQSLSEAGGGRQAEFGPEDLERLEARRDAVKLAQLQAGQSHDVTTKALWSPTSDEAHGPHAAYADAKRQDMDTKLPLLPAAAAQAAIPGLSAQLTPAQRELSHLPAGDFSPLARSRATIAAVESQGLELSSREKRMAERLNTDGGAVEVPWIEGQKANLIDSESRFVKQAHDASLPLKAGISRTTFRMMELAQTLGIDGDDLQLVRSACVSSLVSIEAHSLHEIAAAAGGFSAAGYDARRAYEADNLRPLSEDDLEQCAAKIDCSLRFIRSGTPGGRPGDVPAEETP